MPLSIKNPKMNGLRALKLYGGILIWSERSKTKTQLPVNASKKQVDTNGNGDDDNKQLHLLPYEAVYSKGRKVRL